MLALEALAQILAQSGSTIANPIRRRGRRNGSHRYSIWLQVLLFPLQTSGSGFGEVAHVASPVLYLPLLRGVVEFDVAGPGDLKPADFM
jgi:hypothetical protein